MLSNLVSELSEQLFRSSDCSGPAAPTEAQTSVTAICTATSARVCEAVLQSLEIETVPLATYWGFCQPPLLGAEPGAPLLLPLQVSL